MERRSSARKRAGVQVYVSRPGQRPQRFKTVNISGNGVFVSAKFFACPRNIPVELIFLIKRDSVIRIHRRWATVVHISRRGAGLKLYSTSRPRLTVAPKVSP